MHYDQFYLPPSIIKGPSDALMHIVVLTLISMFGKALFYSLLVTIKHIGNLSVSRWKYFATRRLRNAALELLKGSERFDLYSARRLIGSRIIETAAYCNQKLLALYSTQNSSVNWIIRLLLSLLCWPKVILLSGGYCISFHRSRLYSGNGNFVSIVLLKCLMILTEVSEAIGSKINILHR